jgi:pyruvate-formate lyase-activating enzyme
MDGTTGHRQNSEERVLGPRPSSRDDLMARRLPYCSRLAIVLSTRCNIRCAHCISDCGPRREEALAPAVVERVLRDAARSRTVKVISFTGGEPFLDMPALERLVAYCHELGLESTVITNAFWARADQDAAATLGRLPGLTRLGVSADSFHQEFVPVAYVERAVRAAHDRGIECSVRVSFLDDPDEEIESVRQQLIAVAGWYELEHQPVQVFGRAEQDAVAPRTFRYDASAAFCRSADVHAVQVDGHVTACCGSTGSWARPHALDFGDIHDEPLSTILARADRSLVLHALRLWGPAALRDWGSEVGDAAGLALRPPRDDAMCEMCFDLLTDPAWARCIESAVSSPRIRNQVALARMVELGEIASFAEG